MKKTRDQLLPGQIRHVLTVSLTVAAIILYAALLITAIMGALADPSRVFGNNMERAANLLSGLVGAVVTAGFARSKQPMVGPASTEERETVARRDREHPRFTSLAHRNLASLGEMLGFGGLQLPRRRTTSPGEEPDGAPQQPPPAEGMSMQVWVALIYVIVYLIIGLATFIVAVWKPSAPNIVTNSAWVWCGTMISSVYSFFGLETA